MAAYQPSPDLPLSDTASQPDEQTISYPKTCAASQASTTPKPPDSTIVQSQPPSAQSSSERAERTGSDARTKISNLLKDKEQEWAAVVDKKGPLRLLDLPMDVLKEIVKEVGIYNPIC